MVHILVNWLGWIKNNGCTTHRDKYPGGASGGVQLCSSEEDDSECKKLALILDVVIPPTYYMQQVVSV